MRKNAACQWTVSHGFPNCHPRRAFAITGFYNGLWSTNPSPGLLSESCRAADFAVKKNRIEIKRSIGTISQKVLTTTLRGLERDGYISRKVTPSIPPRVDYELTDLGHDVLVPVTALAQWALAQRQRVERARSEFDRSANRNF